MYDTAAPTGFGGSLGQVFANGWFYLLVGGATVGAMMFSWHMVYVVAFFGVSLLVLNALELIPIGFLFAIVAIAGVGVVLVLLAKTRGGVEA